jgi:hypothetical protein
VSLLEYWTKEELNRDLLFYLVEVTNSLAEDGELQEVESLRGEELEVK